MLPALSPSVIAVPWKLASPSTVKSAPASSSMAAADTSRRLPAVLLPASSVPSSSSIVTAPAELNVRLPNCRASPGWPPSAILVPWNEAFPVTTRLAADGSVIAPPASARRPAMTPSRRSIAEGDILAAARLQDKQVVLRVRGEIPCPVGENRAVGGAQLNRYARARGAQRQAGGVQIALRPIGIDASRRCRETHRAEARPQLDGVATGPEACRLQRKTAAGEAGIDVRWVATAANVPRGFQHHRRGAAGPGQLQIRIDRDVHGLVRRERELIEAQEVARLVAQVNRPTLSARPVRRRSRWLRPNC